MSFSQEGNAAVSQRPTLSSSTNGILSSHGVSEKTAFEVPPAAFIPLRDIIGCPTPIGVMGFVMSLTPLSTNLMGWRVHVNDGAAEMFGTLFSFVLFATETDNGRAAYFFFGGILMLVAGLLELILKNTFLSMVFMSFGSFWLFFGGTLQPFFAAPAAYGGADQPAFPAALGYLFLCMALLCVFFFIAGLRTNLGFEWIFFTVIIGLGLIVGALWKAAEGQTDTARTCAKAAGAFLFICSIGGWYLLFALMLQAVDFPILLPVGDLSGIIQGRTQKMKAGVETRRMEVPPSS